MLKKGNNLIFYDKDVSLCYEGLGNKENLCIFFEEPSPILIVRLVKILTMINPYYKFNKAHITIAELKGDYY